jgi:hypothetical protein
MTATETPPAALAWVRRGRDFYSDATGRFDLMLSMGVWVVYDTERPARFQGEDRGACERWCERRANQGVRRG